MLKWLHSIPCGISFNLVGHLTYLENFKILTLVTPGDPGWCQKWLHSIPRAIYFNLLGHLTYLENFSIFDLR